MLKGYTVVIGITGSIAAYKTPEIIRWLDKNGATVHVIMTESATKFITPLTLRELSHHPVVVDQFQEPLEFNVQHVSLARKADIMVIVPATANIIGKIAGGIADDMLSTTVMATKAPVLICPAMNTQMFINPVVQSNIHKLEELGYHFASPIEGKLLCGEEGLGHLAELTTIQEKILSILKKNRTMAGLKVLVTAGGTREFIDPVRFIGNLSTGKMGVACALAAQKAGAEVTLIAANVELPLPDGMETICVVNTKELEEVLLDKFATSDITIMAAAVADFRPAEFSGRKVKREKTGEFDLRLIPNPDLAQKLSVVKRENQVVIGFAAETEKLEENAYDKLQRKKFDLIVANDITAPGSGFAVDTNQAILMMEGKKEVLPLMPKTELGVIIMERAYQIWKEKNPDKN